mmetsp:Transcript_9974/g.14289  ORF Transcript_9974/g.14289 Transcript_9974/m.14289 type:complete len:89 (+) Transcript_9974:508-774(+)
MSRSIQQLSMLSSYHRHGPFQDRLGSTANAFRMMTNVVRPQYAGSGCVCSCSIKEKKADVPPVDMADAKISFPSIEENDVKLLGNVLR